MKTAVLSGLLCIAAGLYLLSSQSAGESSYLELIAHGMGLYFLGKGVYVFGSLGKLAEANEHLEYLAKIAELEEHRRAQKLPSIPS